MTFGGVGFGPVVVKEGAKVNEIRKECQEPHDRKDSLFNGLFGVYTGAPRRTNGA